MHKTTDIKKLESEARDLRLDDLEQQLLNDFQKDFPLTPNPFGDIAQRYHVTEQRVLNAYQRLQQTGVLSRIGTVFRPHRVGTSTLAAMAVPEDRLEEIADMVSAYEAVNHNYEREHRFNLWFVVTAADDGQLQAVLDDIERRCGLRVLRLPMLEDYHIDLGFPLQWHIRQAHGGEI